MIRRATSPRLAIRIFLNIVARLKGSRSYESKARSYESMAAEKNRSLRALRSRRLNVRGASSRPYREQALAVLHRLSVLDVDAHDLAVVLRVDFVHQLHRLDDAEHLPFFHR